MEQNRTGTGRKPSSSAVRCVPGARSEKRTVGRAARIAACGWAGATLVLGISCGAEAPADHAVQGGFPGLHVSLRLDRGEDRGQNFGSLFEIRDGAGRAVAGAGFMGAYNSTVHGERNSLQFFVAPDDDDAVSLERLPRMNDRDSGLVLRGGGGESFWPELCRWPRRNTLPMAPGSQCLGACAGCRILADAARTRTSGVRLFAGVSLSTRAL